MTFNLDRFLFLSKIVIHERCYPNHRKKISVHRCPSEKHLRNLWMNPEQKLYKYTDGCEVVLFIVRRNAIGF